MQLFSADTTLFFIYFLIFALENMKKLLSKIAHNIFFFSIANQPKTTPNLIFCSIKIVSLRNFYKITLHASKCLV